MQLIYLIDIFQDDYNILRDPFETDSVNVMKHRPLVAKRCQEKIPPLKGGVRVRLGIGLGLESGGFFPGGWGWGF